MPVAIDHGLALETLTPCPLNDRDVFGAKALAELAAGYRATAVCANGKIETIAASLAGANQKEWAR